MVQAGPEGPTGGDVPEPYRPLQVPGQDGTAIASEYPTEGVRLASQPRVEEPSGGDVPVPYLLTIADEDRPAVGAERGIPEADGGVRSLLRDPSGGKVPEAGDGGDRGRPRDSPGGEVPES